MRYLTNLESALLLEDEDIEFELESPCQQYVLVYSTRPIAKDKEHPTEFERTYWLEISGTNSVIVDPWDSFDLAKQQDLIHNLMDFAGYRLRAAFDGWQLDCPKCGHQTSGKIWRNSPKKCESMIQRKKCKHPFAKTDKQRTPLIPACDPSPTTFAEMANSTLQAATTYPTKSATQRRASEAMGLTAVVQGFAAGAVLVESRQNS